MRSTSSPSDVVPLTGQSIVTSESEPSEKQERPTKNRNRIYRLKWKKRLAKRKFSRKQLRDRKKTKQESELVQEKPLEWQRKSLHYLNQWAEDRENWRFKTLQQAWLINHVFDDTLLPKEYFRLFRLYALKLVGKARETLITKCQSVLENRDSIADNPASQQSETNGMASESQPINRVSASRAKSLLKRLLSSNE